MEFHRVTRAALANPTTADEAVDQTEHIVSTTRKDDRDTAPLQFISSSLLEHYQRCEAELKAILAAGALSPDNLVAPIE